MGDMKLSEAMRLGATLKPQAFGFLVDAFGNTCAIGAALDGVGCIGTMRAGNIGYHLLYRLADSEFPLLQSMAAHPSQPDTERPLAAIIQNLNDDHRWTREQIANWVETIECAHDNTDAGGNPGAEGHAVTPSASAAPERDSQ